MSAQLPSPKTFEQAREERMSLLRSEVETRFVRLFKTHGASTRVTLYDGRDEETFNDTAVAAFATCHDMTQLMRDAGWDSDYYVDVRVMDAFLFYDRRCVVMFVARRPLITAYLWLSKLVFGKDEYGR